MTQLSSDAQHLLKIFTDTWNQRLNARNHNLRFQAREACREHAHELAMQLMRDVNTESAAAPANTDITLTEAFWRERYPDADDAEIAQRLSNRCEQIADHAVRCTVEEAQDRANLAARADQPDDDRDEDEDSDNEFLPCGCHYTDCTCTGFEAEPTLDELLASRTVIESYTSKEGVHKTYSGLTISAMEPAFKQLTAVGYIAKAQGDGRCPGCGANCHHVSYDLPDQQNGPFFNICFQCCKVYEQASDYFEELPELNEAVTAHPEGLPTMERIAPVQRDLSSVDQTAPKPSLSAAASTL